MTNNCWSPPILEILSSFKASDSLSIPHTFLVAPFPSSLPILNHYFSKCGFWSSSISISEEVHRNASYGSHPDMKDRVLEARLSNLWFTKPSKGLWWLMVRPMFYRSPSMRAFPFSCFALSLHPFFFRALNNSQKLTNQKYLTISPDTFAEYRPHTLLPTWYIPPKYLNMSEITGYPPNTPKLYSFSTFPYLSKWYLHPRVAYASHYSHFLKHLYPIISSYSSIITFISEPTTIILTNHLICTPPSLYIAITMILWKYKSEHVTILI